MPDGTHPCRPSSRVGYGAVHGLAAKRLRPSASGGCLVGFSGRSRSTALGSAKSDQLQCRRAATYDQTDGEQRGSRDGKQTHYFPQTCHIATSPLHRTQTHDVGRASAVSTRRMGTQLRQQGFRNVDGRHASVAMCGRPIQPVQGAASDERVQARGDRRFRSDLSCEAPLLRAC